MPVLVDACTDAVTCARLWRRADGQSALSSELAWPGIRRHWVKKWSIPDLLNNVSVG